MTLEETARVLEDLTRDEPAARAALSTAEAELEQRRIESAEAGRERNLVAEKHQELSRMIAERERELAVAQERRSGPARPGPPLGEGGGEGPRIGQPVAGEDGVDACQVGGEFVDHGIGPGGHDGVVHRPVVAQVDQVPAAIVRGRQIVRVLC